jgi:tetraacyldisaccharide 4'-kinase
MGAEAPPLAAMCQAAMYPFSVVYGVGVSLRNAAYGLHLRRAEKLPGPVVSIGNLSFGGTGKTPMVEWAVKQLLDMGRRPAILSRGYGARAGQKGEFATEECAVLAENLKGVPHRCDPDRLRAARHAHQEDGADCFVLDDGFQHRRAHRDLDVVLVDASAPRRAMRLLPMGSLRESLSALRRADVAVLTHVDLCTATTLRSFRRMAAAAAPAVPIAEAVHRPSCVVVLPGGTEAPAEALRGKKVLAFCGIGNPESFALTLQKLGAEVVGAVYYPDHHAYTDSDRAFLTSEAGRLGADLCVTTQKDAVKVTPLWQGGGLGVLKVEMEIVSGREMLLEKMQGKLMADR